MSLEIITITNQDERFYLMLGPFLAHRSIEKEIGGRMYDDDGKTWFVALENGVVVGFCAGIMRGKEVHFQSAYVLPSHRGKGIYRALCAQRDEHFLLIAHARVTCKKENLAFLRSIGFKLKRKKGSFYELHRA